LSVFVCVCVCVCVCDNGVWYGCVKPKLFDLRQNFFLSHLLSFCTIGRWTSCLCVCLDAMLLPQLYYYPNLSEGANSISGQLYRDRECPYSGITNFGRVWRKVMKSNTWSACQTKHRAVSWSPRMRVSVQKEDALDALAPLNQRVDDKGPSVVTQTNAGTVSKEVLGNFWETGWSA